jgi:UDP-glucuronate 4-epimerase
VKRILVTGAAGFIGSHVSRFLCAKGYRVIGLDNLNDYYDVGLKKDRLGLLADDGNFSFVLGDIRDRDSLVALFRECRPSHVIHLAAQAGVRDSISDPYKYVDNNILGFLNVLEACRENPVCHLLYASSSSVYGNPPRFPSSASDMTDSPISLYGATKKSNELMAHAYGHLFGIPCTGMRFFTVYGPWGRPDMAYYKFTKCIFEGLPLTVYDNGAQERDFTYIDDIVQGIFLLLDRGTEPKCKGSSEGGGPCRVFNIGNGSPVSIMEVVRVLESRIGQKVSLRFLDAQPGDVAKTFADVRELREETGFVASTGIEEGLKRFVDWYMGYHPQ